LNIPAKFGIFIIAIEMADSGEPPVLSTVEGHVLVSADTRIRIPVGCRQWPILKNLLFAWKGEVLNLGHLDFDIVSNFVLRISYFASLGTSTTVEDSLQIRPFFAKRTQFQKKSNELKSFYNNELRTTNYELRSKKRTQNEPKQSQFIVSLPALSAVEWVEPISEAKKYSYERNFLFDIYT
jgi:hypothetical protein